MNKMSPQRARERALFLYRNALERGDFDAVMAVLKLAERDSVLLQMIEEMAELDEGPIARPGRRFMSLFSKSKGITEVVIRRDFSPDGWPPIPDQSEEETDMFTTFVPARSPQFTGARKLRWDPITLAVAVLVVVVLGMVLLFMRAAFNPGAGGAPEEALPEFAAQPDECDLSMDHLLSGNSALESGDYEMAIMEFTCVIEADDTNLEAHLGRGSAYVLAGDLLHANYDYGLVSMQSNPQVFRDAITRYSSSIEANPDDITAYILRVYTNYTSPWGGPLDEVYADGERIIELDPNNAFGYLFRGFANWYLGNRQAAEEDYIRALELAPNNPAFYAHIATDYRRGFPDRALENVNRAIELAPEEQGVYYLLRATIRNQTGHDVLAGEDLVRFMELIQTEVIVQNMELNVPTTLPMTAGQVYRISFQVEAGQSVSISAPIVNDSSFPVMVLLADDGTPLIGLKSDPSWGYTIPDYTIPADGTYTVLVTTATASHTALVTVFPLPNEAINLSIILNE